MTPGLETLCIISRLENEKKKEKKKKHELYPAPWLFSAIERVLLYFKVTVFLLF